MIKYEKILIFQYGKVGSSSILHCENERGAIGNATSLKIYEDNKEYNEYIIQTHSHEVAKDILSKYKNILVINIVRFPIDRNISAFFENIKLFYENYNQVSINELPPQTPIQS